MPSSPTTRPISTWAAAAISTATGSRYQARTRSTTIGTSTRSYGTADLDFGIDIDTLAIGAGYRYPLKDEVDIYGRVLYISSDVDVPGPRRRRRGRLGAAGCASAYRVSDEFEVEGGIQHVDVFDSDTSLQASARYHFNESFSAGIGLTFAGDTDSFGINARYSF